MTGPTPTGTPALTPAATQALQGALAAQHAVIWGYGLIGAKVDERLRPTVTEARGAHRAQRDVLTSLLGTVGAEPVPPEPSYDTPFPVADRGSALKLAVHLEDGAAGAWHHVLASAADEEVRRVAATGLSDAAVRATRWRSASGAATPTVPFPGATR